MAVTIRRSDAPRFATGTNRLSYTLELSVDLNESFYPFEKKTLKTGMRATPHTACILFCTKVSSVSSPPHTVDFVALGPDELKPGRGSGGSGSSRDDDDNDPAADNEISVEVSNPSSETLPPQETPLRLILFALPLSPVRPGLLWIQKRAEDPRGRPRFPISILSATPSIHSLDVELVASNLCWKPASTRERRLATTIPLNMFKADIRRYNTAEIRSCTQKGVYVHEVTIAQTTGNAYLNLLTRRDDDVPPSSLVLRIVFREEETSSSDPAGLSIPGPLMPPMTATSTASSPSPPSPRGWVAFNTYPDPTFCTPRDHGLTITCPRNVHLFPGHRVRVEISVSFCSEHTHLGLFIPAPRENVSCQMVAWQERQILSLSLTAEASMDLERGDLLGTAYFLPSTQLRPRGPTQRLQTTSTYTALLSEPPPPTTRKRRLSGGKPKRTELTSGERDFWVGYPPTETRRRRLHTEMMYSGYPIAYPKPSTTLEQPPDAERHEPPAEDHGTLEIYPCGTIFKLKQLIPLILEEGGDGGSDRRSGPATGGPRGPPKKISTATSLRIDGRWTAERRARSKPRLAWRDTETVRLLKL